MLWNCVPLRRAPAMVAVFILAGCGLDGLFGNDGGRVRVVLSRDDGAAMAAAVANLATNPGAVSTDEKDGDKKDGDKDHGNRWRFQAATVTLSSILARTNDGELVDLDVDLPIDVDVVKIDGGRQLLLPDGFLPADIYDQVVLVITAVQGVTHDGTVVTIEPPGGGWTAVVPICPLEVLEGETTLVSLALNVRNSFVQARNWWSFHPRFRSLTHCDD